jgi:hypothetical protein
MRASNQWVSLAGVLDPAEFSVDETRPVYAWQQRGGLEGNTGMQFRMWSAGVLFLGSYAPLAFVLAAQDIKKALWGEPVCGWRGQFDCELQIFEHPWASLAAIVVTSAALWLTMYSMMAVRLKSEAEVLSAKPVPNDLINYVFPYVVSFMGLSYGDPQKLAGFFVFLVLLFLITYRSGQILMNPVLIAFGWRLYEVDIVVGGNKVRKTVRALKQGKLLPGKQLIEDVQEVYLMGDP